jgi:hypothetical protein
MPIAMSNICQSIEAITGVSEIRLQRMRSPRISNVMFTRIENRWSITAIWQQIEK